MGLLKMETNKRIKEVVKKNAEQIFSELPRIALDDGIIFTMPDQPVIRICPVRGKPNMVYVTYMTNEGRPFENCFMTLRAFLDAANASFSYWDHSVGTEIKKVIADFHSK